MMRLAPLLLFLHVSVLSAAPPIGKPGARGDKAKAKPKGGVIPTGVDPSEYAKAAHDATCQCYLMSCTITPQPRARGGGFTPDDCLEACEDWMQDLNTEFALRMGDGHVECYIISLPSPLSASEAEVVGRGVSPVANPPPNTASAGAEAPAAVIRSATFRSPPAGSTRERVMTYEYVRSHDIIATPPCVRHVLSRRSNTHFIPVSAALNTFYFSQW